MGGYVIILIIEKFLTMMPEEDTLMENDRHRSSQGGKKKGERI